MIQPQIFIVEDDNDDFLFIEDALTYVAPDLGYKRFVDSQDLCKYINDQDKHIPALFIIDYNLPLKNGLEVMQILNSLHRYEHVPKVFYSNSTFGQHKTNALASGALAYYTKATSIDDIRKNVLEMLLHSNPAVV